MWSAAKKSVGKILLNVLILFCSLVGGAVQAFSIFDSPITTITINFSSSFISQMALGATHNQDDADSWNDATAVASAKQLMITSLDYQNQHIMGWGAEDPEPSPGVYNWESLDARVQLMRDTKAKMILTLCCAPGWMRPAGYQDDWKYIETAPDSAHVQDFANLTKEIALRYPDIKYFQIWNEFKGMWSTEPSATPGIENSNQWDYVRYTTLYNAVYDAIRSVRPDAQLGGPYIVMDSDGNKAEMSNPGPSYSWGTLDQRPLDAIQYWLQHKHGADFITIDGGSANKDNIWLTDEFASAQKFVDIYNWIRTQPDGGATLPIWWAEWYASSKSSTSTSSNQQYYNALMASDIIYTLRSGASLLLIWKPQGDDNGLSFPEGIWTDTSKAGGGQPTAYYATSRAFKDFFGPDTVFYTSSATTNDVTVLSSTQKTMIVNHLSYEQKVIINHYDLSLNPYEVKVIDTSLIR